MTLRSLAAVLVALLETFVAAGGARAGSDDGVQFSRETTAVAHLLELASSPKFCLVLSPGTSRLVLMLEGAVLREYSIEGSEVAEPRVAFFWRRTEPAVPDSAWMEQVWQGGELDPPRKQDRIEFTAAPPDSNRPEGSVEVPIPPPVEEAIIPPERYFVRFQGGLALEIRATTTPARHLPERFRLAWEDRLAALRSHPADHVRLRLLLAPDDHDAFYRSLPPDVSLVVLPPTLHADGT